MVQQTEESDAIQSFIVQLLQAQGVMVQTILRKACYGWESEGTGTEDQESILKALQGLQM